MRPSHQRALRHWRKASVAFFNPEEIFSSLFLRCFIEQAISERLPLCLVNYTIYFGYLACCLAE